jgi:hypothetical protein
MADVDGFEFVITPFASSAVGSRALEFVEGIGAGATINYIMEAKDSVTGVTYRWATTSPDFAGTGYPGPNAATQIAVSMTKTG